MLEELKTILEEVKQNNYDNIANIYNCFKKETSKVYNRGFLVNEQVVKNMLNMISIYNEIKTKVPIVLLSEDDQIIKDYTSYLMTCLKRGFFELSNDSIKTIISIIKNNDYIKSIANNEVDDKSLDEDYLFEYTSKFLLNSKIVNENIVKEDILLNSIKEGKITSAKLLLKIIMNTPIDNIMTVFDGNITKLLDSIDSSIKSLNNRKKVYEVLTNKLIYGRYPDDFIESVVTDKRIINYVSKKDIEAALKVLTYSYPGVLKEKVAKYLLANVQKPLVVINLHESISLNDWSEEFKNKLEEEYQKLNIKPMSFKEAIEYLDNLFKNEQRNTNLFEAFEAMKAIIRGGSKKDIKLFLCSTNHRGCVNNGNKSISIDINILAEMLAIKNNDQLPISIDIISILFHEYRHVEQFEEIEKDNPSKKFYKMYKEKALVHIIDDYYNDNYKNISYEIDARIAANTYLLSFLDSYFPYMTKSIGFYTARLNNEKEYKEGNKKIFEQNDVKIDGAIEKLVSINPSILKKYPHLQKETINEESQIKR